MQRSSKTSGRGGRDAAACARAVMDATPPVIWFMRREMRRRRGSLSLPRFRTLVRVDNGEAGVSAVASHLGTSVPTASRIVAGLVGRGLLARRPSRADRRRVALVVTPKGRDVLDGARAATLTRLADELGRLSADDRGVVVAAMRLLRSVFATPVDVDPPEGPADDPDDATRVAAAGRASREARRAT